MTDTSLVGVSGLEPEKAGPESAVLPLHHTPICFTFCSVAIRVFLSRNPYFRIASAKLRTFFYSSKHFRRFFS